MLEEAKKKLYEFEEYKANTVETIQNKINLLDKRIKNSYIDKLEGNLPMGMTDNDWNKLHREWHEERDKLCMRLKEANDVAKMVYDRVELVMQFSNQLPMLFKTFDANRKKMIMDILTEEITFDGQDIYVKLKPIFDEVRNLNRTLKTPVNTTKNSPEELFSKNGAGNGSELEPLTSHISYLIDLISNIPQENNFENNIKMCLVA